eukprot:2514938-Amphidinium_carterae.1
MAVLSLCGSVSRLPPMQTRPQAVLLFGQLQPVVRLGVLSRHPLNHGPSLSDASGSYTFGIRRHTHTSYQGCNFPFVCVGVCIALANLTLVVCCCCCWWVIAIFAWLPCETMPRICYGVACAVGWDHGS